MPASHTQKYKFGHISETFWAPHHPPPHFDHPEKKTYTPDWLLPTKD